MRSRSGTTRWIDAIHDFSRLNKLRFGENGVPSTAEN
jgi:hypothetical protein